MLFIDVEESLDISYTKLSPSMGVVLSLNTPYPPCDFSCQFFHINPNSEDLSISKVPGLNYVCLIHSRSLSSISVYYECKVKDGKNSTSILRSNSLEIPLRVLSDPKSLLKNSYSMIYEDPAIQVQQVNTFNVVLECSEKLSLSIFPYILCRSTFNTYIATFDAHFFILNGGIIIYSTIIFRSSDYSIVLTAIQLLPHADVFTCQLLSGAAYDGNDAISSASETITINLNNTNFSVTIKQNDTTIQSCTKGYFTFIITTSTPVLNIPPYSISLYGSTIKDIKRINSTK